jgi:hypothetical protein
MFSRAQYQLMAEEAARLSEAATTEENRVIWMKIAEGYRELAGRADELRAVRAAEPDDDED